MEKSEITAQLSSVQSAKDLAHLLDQIKRDEFAKVRYSITKKMLRHYSSDAINPKRFRTFHIRKKSGGQREIKAPCRQLDVILTCVNILLNAVYKPSDAAMGFTAGKSVLNNARIHVGHNYVFNIDLKDFFPSIPQARVWKRLQLPPFSFPVEVANIVAGLCCSYDETVNLNVLPQGSPASPLLTNAICDNLDRRMKGVAKRFGLHYTRYADDMTFSSMHNVYQEGGEFRTEIKRIITGQGFRMNEAKTRLQKTGARQEVTGLTVNAIANVSRKYISDLRWILHVWETEGYAKAYALFYPKYKHEKGYIKKGEPVMENVVGGKLNYLKMVRGATNPAYQKLAARFEALQEHIFVDNETDDAKSYVYVQPYTIANFQALFHTQISLEISRDGKLIGKCVIDNKDKVLAISKSTQKILCPELSEMAPGDVIQSDDLKSCFVTLCRNRGKNFWLITKFRPKRSHCLSIQNLKVRPDELLSLWEKNGLEDTAEELAKFIQYAGPGESILDWNPLLATQDEEIIDRGVVETGKEYLLGYFLKNRELTGNHKKRLIKLLISENQDKPQGMDAETLLTIWENQGLDAAVEVWKTSLSKEADTQKGQPAINKQKAKGKSAPDDKFLSEMGIPKETWAALQKELEADNSASDAADDSITIAEL